MNQWLFQGNTPEVPLRNKINFTQFFRNFCQKIRSLGADVLSCVLAVSLMAQWLVLSAYSTDVR